jgi:thioredoxin 1
MRLEWSQTAGEPMQRFETPIISNDQSIDRVLATGWPLVLIFLDGLSPPALDPVMDRLARDNTGQLVMVKVNVKDSAEVARRYQVRRTPAVVTLRSGQTVSRAEGISAADLEHHVAYLLGKGPRPDVAQPDSSPAGEGAPIAVTDSTFDQEVLRSASPVLVDFWAPWCGPCRMVEPAVEKLAQEHAGRLRVVKVNADENPDVMMRYGVQSIPTMMIVRDGQIVDRWTGALPEGPLRARVSRSLNN